MRQTEMKKKLAHCWLPTMAKAVIATGVIVLSTTSANATVMGAGELNLEVDTTAVFVAPRYNYGNRLYGSVSDTSMNPVRVEAYLDAGTYQNETTNGGSSLRGSFDLDTGAAAFAYSATAPTSDGSSAAAASVDLYGALNFTGTLNGFGYSYSFFGEKDEPTNSMGFGVQMEISFYDADSSSWLKVYSDYGTSNFASDLVGSDIWRTNWVWERDTSNSEMNLTGSRDFGDLSRYGDRRWEIRYDLQSWGQDRYGPSQTPPITPPVSTVPEPALFTLLSLGLVGLGFARRKQT